MSEIISVSLPDDVVADVDAISTADGVSRDELIRSAIEGYVADRKFYELRGRVVPHAQREGFVTDEDVFRQVS
jgi:metal-responsive CopG/Arc/MetJ family transcriptional regulator